MRVNKKGFTLVELILVMAVFMVVLIITSSSFKTVLDQSTKLFRSEESNIEGMIGLEMLRHDVQQTGFGLFTEPPPLDFAEATVSPAQAYNDSGGSPPYNVPRPLVAGNDLSASGIGDITDDDSNAYNVLDGTDYLVIKATTVGTSQTSQKWSYIIPIAGGAAPYTWPSNAENFTSSQERFAVLRRSFSNPPRTTIEKNSSDNTLWFKINTPAFDVYTSQGRSIITAYGFTNNITNESLVRFPFNRTDYFVARPKSATSMPPVCAPNTGMLYKATVKHADGKLSYMPILDCVADMQVVLGWDMDGNGAIDMYSNADGTVCSGGVACAATVAAALSTVNNNSAATQPNVRNNLKIAKVYLLAQSGRRDPGYSSPSPIVVGDTGETALTRSYDLAANNLLNYRWKLYRIVVRPKNLPANQ